MINVKKCLPKSIKKLIRRFISFVFWDEWQQNSWSQEGEDLILQRIFECVKHGFYVDIGAHHPKRFSNTYLFYKRGWNGINVDAMPGSMRLFNKCRPRDVNVEMGVGLQKSNMNYYIFNEPALNGFSREISLERDMSFEQYKIIDIVNVEISPLSKILDKYVPHGKAIDFLTIDVEGLDFDVLKSNDWVKFRPKYVLVEILNCKFSEINISDVGTFMNNIGYTVFAKSMNTVFFQDVSVQ